MSFQAGSIIGDKYELGALLGEGGMGSVYEATELGTGEQWALKLIDKSPRARDSHYLGRLQREGEILSALKHQHIVRVYDLGIDAIASVPYIVMERLHGEDCGRRVAAQGAMPARQARTLLDQVCDALRALHGRGIVHRDLKPENVFLARKRQGQETVKLLDFGIAKVVADGANNSIIIGTPHCISPEQLVLNAPITPATDIWALGLLAFFVLTGKHYWLEANPSQPSQIDYGKIFAEIMNDSLRESASRRAVRLKCPSTCIPSVKFDDWFGRCLVNDPGKRLKDVELAHRELSTVWRIEVGKARPSVSGLSNLPENDLIAYAADELRKRLQDALQIMREGVIGDPINDRGTPPPIVETAVREDVQTVAPAGQTVVANRADLPHYSSQDGSSGRTVLISVSQDPGSDLAVVEPSPDVQANQVDDGTLVPLKPQKRRGRPPVNTPKAPPSSNNKAVLMLAAGVVLGLSLLAALAIWQDAIRSALGLE